MPYICVELTAYAIYILCNGKILPRELKVLIADVLKTDIVFVDYRTAEKLVAHGTVCLTDNFIRNRTKSWLQDSASVSVTTFMEKCTMSGLFSSMAFIAVS